MTNTLPMIEVNIYTGHSQRNQDLLVCEYVMNVAINRYAVVCNKLSNVCRRCILWQCTAQASPRRWCLGPLPALIFTPLCTDCTLSCAHCYAPNFACSMQRRGRSRTSLAWLITRPAPLCLCRPIITAHNFQMLSDCASHNER